MDWREEMRYGDGGRGEVVMDEVEKGGGLGHGATEEAVEELGRRRSERVALQIR